MTYRIPLMRYTFAHERETRAALLAWLASPDSAHLSMGQQCAQFEHSFAAWQGRKHAILFNSGSSANLAIWQSLRNQGLRIDRRVGFSALTWSTNVMPLQQLGFRPYPIDTDPCTLNVMSANLLDFLETQELDALFITNALGYLPDLDKIADICRERDMILIEDNCESLGSTLPAGKAGNFGLMASFSFFVAHHMSTIEGGMVCTDDDDYADMLRMVRANGWDRNLSPERQAAIRAKHGIGDFEGAYTFYASAYNMRPTEIAGFLGCEQLKYLDESLAERELRFVILETNARNNPDFIPLDRSHMATLSPFAFPVVCQDRDLRNLYAERFIEAGVEIRPIIAGNIARQPFYKVKHHADRLVGADKVSECGFYMGVYPEMTVEDMDILIECLERPE